MSTKNSKKRKKSKAMLLLEEITGEELTFANALKSIRECDEITQETFSKTLGISRQNLCDIEKGRKFVAPGRAAKFAKILGYPEEVFITLSLQDSLQSEGLNYFIYLEHAA